jgi:hypothetical protein
MTKREEPIGGSMSGPDWKEDKPEYEIGDGAGASVHEAGAGSEGRIYRIAEDTD